MYILRILKGDTSFPLMMQCMIITLSSKDSTLVRWPSEILSSTFLMNSTVGVPCHIVDDAADYH